MSARTGLFCKAATARMGERKSKLHHVSNPPLLLGWGCRGQREVSQKTPETFSVVKLRQSPQKERGRELSK